MPTVITQRGAFEAGLDRYYTGRTCKRGHLAERYVRNGACIDCLRVYSQKYRRVANPHTRELMPWAPCTLWAPSSLTPEQVPELEAYLAVCIEKWAAHKGLLTPEMAAAYALHREFAAREK